MLWRPRLLTVKPPELVVYDEEGACPYLSEQVARMPLRVPTRVLSPEELEVRLDKGDRRQGALLYRTACPTCSACEPIRVDVNHFKPGKTQRRIHRRGKEMIEIELGKPELSQEKVDLYNRHKFGRGLSHDRQPIDQDGYRVFLVDTCCDTFEIRYRIHGELIGVAVVDRGANSLSAVYFYFDPRYEHLSPGVFSILTQVDLCKDWHLQYLYLGLYIQGCASMAYKSRYLPHERLIQGKWAKFTHS